MGVAANTKKIYMWGNFKYYGASTSTSTVMQRTPLLIKDLESHKIKKVFCSQTYAYVITDNDEIKSWGEWFRELTRDEFIAASLAKVDVNEDENDVTKEGEQKNE